MTGFGEARRQEADLSVAAEVRTVNSRYFKLSLRISDGYGGLEPEIENLVRERIKRGTVQVSVSVQRTLRADDYQLNATALESYRQQLARLFAKWKLTEPMPLAALLTLPGVVSEDAAAQRDVSEDWPVVQGVLNAALDTLEKMRRAEGQAMAADLLEAGIYVVGFAYPVVPRGQARIRVQLSAAHAPEHVDRAVDAFVRVGRAHGVV